MVQSYFENQLLEYGLQYFSAKRVPYALGDLDVYPNLYSKWYTAISAKQQ
jgi:hypothetical protein